MKRENMIKFIRIRDGVADIIFRRNKHTRELEWMKGIKNAFSYHDSIYGRVWL